MEERGRQPGGVAGSRKRFEQSEGGQQTGQRRCLLCPIGRTAAFGGAQSTRLGWTAQRRRGPDPDSPPLMSVPSGSHPRSPFSHAAIPATLLCWAPSRWDASCNDEHGMRTATVVRVS
jgi:hypothetical protein